MSNRNSHPPAPEPPAPLTPADQVIGSPAVLLANALELAHDAAERYAQLGASLTTHHNLAAAEVLERVVALADAHAATIARHASTERPPSIAPWQFKWRCPELLATPIGAEADAELDYQMTAAQALRLTVRHEHCAQRFYLDAANTSGSAAARRLAERIAALQARHIARLQAMLEAALPAETPVSTDLDPPHRPE